VDREALKTYDRIKKSDLEGLVIKRKEGKYAQQTLWYKVLNATSNRKPAVTSFSAVKLARNEDAG